MQIWEYLTISYRYASRVPNVSNITISPSNMLNTDWFRKIFPNAKISLNDVKDLLIVPGVDNWSYAKNAILNYFGSLGWEAYAACESQYGDMTVYFKHPIE